MVFLRVSLALSVLAATVLAGFYDKKTGVVNVDISTFDKQVGVDDNEVAFVEFYAPWCGHCKNLIPDYIKLAKSTKGLIKVFAVDAADQKNQALAQRFGVKGFPTLKVFARGEFMDYNGERSAKAMKQFALSKLPSFVKKVTMKSIEGYLSKGADDIPRALVIAKKSSVSPTVKRLSALSKGSINFAQISSSDKKVWNEISDKLGGLQLNSEDQKTTLVVYPKGVSSSPDNQPQVYSGNPGKIAELVGFLASFAPEIADSMDLSSTKLPELYDESCFYEHCSKKGLCVILIRGEKESDNTKSHSILKDIEESKDDASLFAFSQIDGQEERPWVEALFGDLNAYYSNIVILSPNKKRFAQYVGSPTKEAIWGWISGVLSGRTATSPIASDELPTLSTETTKCKSKKKESKKTKKPSKPSSGSTGGPASPGKGSPYLLALDDSNFKSVVFKSDIPAIVEFYAPWCGHCKALAPEYAKAADRMKGMVTFAGVDCNEEKNKPLCGRFGIQGFPTLKLFESGARVTGDAKDYQSGRDAKSIERAAASLLNSVKVTNVDNAQSVKDMIGQAGLVFISSKKKPPTMVKALSARFKKEASIAFAAQSEVQDGFFEELNLSESELPIVLQFQPESTEILTYSGPKTFEALAATVDIIVEMAKSGKSEL